MSIRPAIRSVLRPVARGFNTSDQIVLISNGFIHPNFDAARRNSVGTYADQNGILRSVGSNILRFPRTGRGALFELTGINTAKYNESIGGANWTNSALTLDSSTILAPNETLTASLLNEGSITASHSVIPGNIPYTLGNYYVWSVFAKAGSGNLLQVGFANGSHGATAYTNFDLSNGTITAVGASATAAIEAWANGWYRCSVTAPATSTIAGTTPNFCFIPAGNAGRTPSFAGTNRTIAIWGAQHEDVASRAGAVCSSYISNNGNTTNSCETDFCSGNIAGFGLGLGEMTLFGEALIPALAATGNAQTILQLDNGTTGNRYTISNRNGAAVQILNSNAGVTSPIYTIGNAAVYTTFKWALTIKTAQGELKASMNGGSIQTSSGGPASPNILRFGSGVSGTGNLMGTTSAFALPYAVNDADLMKLSA